MENAAGFALLCLLLATIPGRPGNQPVLTQQNHDVSFPSAMTPKIIDTSRLDGGGGSVRGAVEGSNGSGNGGGSTAPPVNVYAAYSSEPAPMGVADYGVGPHGAYDYSSNSTLGSISLISLSAINSTSSPWVSFQLNENLQFYEGSVPFVYWVQDVAILDTATHYIYFVNNIWNSSSVTAMMSKAGVSGGGQIYGNSTRAYYAVAASAFLRGNLLRLPYPAVIDFRLNSSLTASGQPEVTFEYNDGYGWEQFDTVVFTSVHSLTAMRGFVVDGFTYKPTGFYDSELVMGGPGSGSKTTDLSSDMSMQLEYWNGHNYQLVANAYNFGSDTAEGVQNVVSRWSYSPAGGAVAAKVEDGAGALGPLWNQLQVSILTIESSIASGTLEVRNSSNAVSTAVTAAADYPFIGDEVKLTLAPGSYGLSIYNGTTLASSGNYSLKAGQVLSLHTPLGSIILTMSYSVAGGGTGYSPPVLTYVAAGVTHEVPLGTDPSAFDLDAGSGWSVSSQLPGSGTTERWEASQPTTGTASSSSVMSLTYYHQFLEDITYSVVGGGTGFSAPSLSGPQLGEKAFLSRGPTSLPTSFWLDSGLTYTATNPLPGSTSSERWFAVGGNQSIVGGRSDGASTISIVYNNQYYLAVKGISSASGWYDSGAPVVVSEPIVYGRGDGMGKRLVAYSLDSGQQTGIAPSPGNVTVPVLMDSSHVLSFSTVAQFEVSLDPTVTEALNSITPPMVLGGGYWYDSGSNVSLVLDGVWGRSSGAGTRLLSYTLGEDSPVPVDTRGTVSTVISGIAAPWFISGESVGQYFLSITNDSGSFVSVTPQPQIPSDTGWYDNGTTVDATFLYSWGYALGGESRANAVAYSISGSNSSSGSGSSGQAGDVPLVRRGNGTFTVSAYMDEERSLAVESVTQYLFTYSGGSTVGLSPPSQTGDGFYDANSELTVTSALVVSAGSNGVRDVLDGYTLDSVSHPISTGQGTSGVGDSSYTTPSILFNMPHALTFHSVRQDLVSFAISDSSGSGALVPPPSSMTVDEPGSVGGQQVGTGLNLWIDNGTTFTVPRIEWEGLNVAPTTSRMYVVASPLAIAIDARVYDLTLDVTDYLSHPVAGAVAQVTLANGTKLTERTDSAGSLTLRQIPLGTFNMTITSLGFSSHLAGDASQGAPIVVKTYGSYLILGMVSIPVAVVIAAVIALFTVRNLSHGGERGDTRWWRRTWRKKGHEAD
jgi:hypothetical protein